MKSWLRISVLGVLTLLLAWAFWELFHCSFHISQDFSLLELPGVKLMMVKKALIFTVALCFLVVTIRKRKPTNAA